MRTLFATAMALTLFVPALAFAGTVVVPDDFTTIQAAVDAAADGDTIVVKAGT